MDRYDVRRPDAPHQARFLEKSELDFLVAGEILVKDLERD
jgi:hypothetical protein